jgi:hypothetical protein
VFEVYLFHAFSIGVDLVVFPTKLSFPRAFGIARRHYFGSRQFLDGNTQLSYQLSRRYNVAIVRG